MANTVMTPEETENALGYRTAQWGHWGLTFFWSNGGYAPTKIEGILYCPVGNAGPMDGYLGSTQRQTYKDIVADWTSRGELPSRNAIQNVRDAFKEWVNS